MLLVLETENGAWVVLSFQANLRLVVLIRGFLQLSMNVSSSVEMIIIPSTYPVANRYGAFLCFIASKLLVGDKIQPESY